MKIHSPTFVLAGLTAAFVALATSASFGQSALLNQTRTSLNRLSLPSPIISAAPVDEAVGENPAVPFSVDIGTDRVRSFRMERAGSAPGKPRTVTSPDGKVVTEVAEDGPYIQTDVALISQALYDTNAPKSSAGGDDWHWDNTAKAGMSILPHGKKDKLKLGLAATVASQRYNQFSSSLDNDVLNLTSSVAYQLADDFGVSFGYGPTWVFSRGFDKNVITVQTLSLGTEKAVVLHKPVPGSWGASLSMVPGVARNFADDGGESDDWEYSLDVNVKYASKSALVEGGPVEPHFEAVLGTSQTYADFDSDRHFWLTKVYGEVDYVFNPRFRVYVSVQFQHDKDSKPDATYDQFVVAPSVGLAFQF